MRPADRLREGMDQLRRGLEQAGEEVRRAARKGGRGATVTTRGQHNVAVAANVGRDGRVQGVKVTQRTRRRPDGREEIVTTREVYGDDDGEG